MTVPYLVQALYTLFYLELLSIFPIESWFYQVVNQRYRIDKNVYVIGIGKAVTGMCRAVEDLLGDEIVRGLAITPKGTVQSLLDMDKRCV